MPLPEEPSRILRERIKKHEGFSSDPYLDTLGHITIGFGHKVQSVSYHEAERLLDTDLRQARIQATTLFSELWLRLNDTRRDVLTEMVFQMGKTGVSKFVKMRQALVNQDYDTAAQEMMKSRWYEQSKGRCTYLAYLMLHGKVLEPED